MREASIDDLQNFEAEVCFVQLGVRDCGIGLSPTTPEMNGRAVKMEEDRPALHGN